MPDITPLIILVIGAAAIGGFFVGHLMNPLIWAYKGTIELIKADKKQLTVDNNNMKGQLRELLWEEEEREESEVLEEPENFMQAAACAFLDKMPDEQLVKFANEAGYDLDAATARTYAKHYALDKLK